MGFFIKGGHMKVSFRFRAAVKLADEPAWKIAHRAGINPNVLSQIMSGMKRVRPGDERVLKVANALGLDPKECFETGVTGNERLGQN
jgi:hypothetical protein